MRDDSLKSVYSLDDQQSGIRKSPRRAMTEKPSQGSLEN
jgi:hypothetical protein